MEDLGRFQTKLRMSFIAFALMGKEDEIQNDHHEIAFHFQVVLPTKLTKHNFFDFLLPTISVNGNKTTNVYGCRGFSRFFGRFGRGQYLL